MNDADRIRADIKKGKVQIKRAEALKRLLKNKDFKSIFLDHFIHDQSVFLVQQKAQPHLQSEEEQKDLDTQIMSISHISLFLREIEAMGLQAKNSIKNHELELDNCREDDGEDS